MKITYEYFNENYSGVGFDKAIAKVMGQNYPNPANVFTVFPAKTANENLTLTVNDLTGRVLLNQNIKSGSQNVVVNASALPYGFYIGSLLDGANVLYSTRFVASHK